VIRLDGCERIIGYADLCKRSCLEERALAARGLANDANEHENEKKIRV
jgi:hypothetical protein